jgi:hypothetical protein
VPELSPPGCRCALARQDDAGEAVFSGSGAALKSISLDDVQRAVWSHYERIPNDDMAKRDAMKTPTELQALYDRILQRMELGELDGNKDPYPKQSRP